MPNRDATALYKYIELLALQCDTTAMMAQISSLHFPYIFHTCERRQLQRDPSSRQKGRPRLVVGTFLVATLVPGLPSLSGYGRTVRQLRTVLHTRARLLAITLSWTMTPEVTNSPMGESGGASR